MIDRWFLSFSESRSEIELERSGCKYLRYKAVCLLCGC